MNVPTPWCVLAERIQKCAVRIESEQEQVGRRELQENVVDLAVALAGLVLSECDPGQNDDSGK